MSIDEVIKKVEECLKKYDNTEPILPGVVCYFGDGKEFKEVKEDKEIERK